MLGPGSDVAAAGSVRPMKPPFPPQRTAPVVQGDGIVLCALEPRDTPAMLENDRDSETAARFGWDPGAAALWRCEAAIERAADLWRTGEGLTFAVREASGGPLLGIVDAQMREHPPGAETGDRAVELSWTTMPGARGRGTATRAVRAMVSFAGTLGFAEVWAKVDRDNPASLAVARAAGFREVSGDVRRVVLSASTGSG